MFYRHILQYGLLRIHDETEKAAVDAFEKAIQYGYYDYAHAQKDTDLDNVRDDKRFQKAMECLREVGDFGYILRKSPGYDDAASIDSLPAFTYMDPNDRDLVRVRRYFNLDSIAGAGDEISKIKICWRGYTIRFVTTVRLIIPKRKMR